MGTRKGGSTNKTTVLQGNTKCPLSSATWWDLKKKKKLLLKVKIFEAISLLFRKCFSWAITTVHVINLGTGLHFVWFIGISHFEQLLALQEPLWVCYYIYPVDCPARWSLSILFVFLCFYKHRRRRNLEQQCATTYPAYCMYICISCNITIPRNSIQSGQYDILAIQQVFRANWRSVPSSYGRHFSTGSMVLVLACLLIFPLFATGGKKEDDLHLEIDYLLKFPVRGWLVSRWYHCNIGLVSPPWSGKIYSSMIPTHTWNTAR